MSLAAVVMFLLGLVAAYYGVAHFMVTGQPH